MRSIILSSILLFSIHSFSQNDSINLDDKYIKYVSSIDEIVSTLYAVISGEKGEERNWELMKYLFMDGAKMIPSGEAKSGEYKMRYTTTEEYIESSGKWLIDNGFFEDEIHRETQQFGNVAHVFSTYQCFHSKKEKEPFMRGINSIQLVYDNSRWWVVNIFWAQESDKNPVPDEYDKN